MNADFNPRGGLIVDRDSLHASPGYARQVEALKQLRERQVNADVEKAVEECLQCGMFCNAGEFHPYAACLMYEACHNAETVRANLEGVRDYALRDQDAELARQYECIRSHGIVTRRAEERAEKADALLRLVVHQWPSLGCESFHHRKADQHGIAEECEPLRRWLALYGCITAHLGGEHE